MTDPERDTAMPAETPVTDHAPLARPQAVPDPAFDAAEQKAELARQVRDGDPGALRTAHERHGQVGVTLALRTLAAQHDAEDVTQPVFLHAWRAHHARSRARRRRRPAGRRHPSPDRRPRGRTGPLTHQQIAALTRPPLGTGKTTSAAGESDYDDDGRATVPHPNPDQLALAALPAKAVEPDVAAHLAICATCQAKVASLRHAVDITRADTTDPGPPPRVWHAIITELDDDLHNDLHDELDGRPSAPPRMPRTRRRRLLVPAAATAASLAAGLIFGLAASSPSLEPAPVTLTQIPLTPLATSDPATSGTADILEADGVRKVVIEVTEPSRPAAAEYLEAWLMDTDGNRLYSLGALTREPDGTRLHGTFRAPPDPSLTAFNTVDVSAERFDGNPTHSGVSLLRGHTA